MRTIGLALVAFVLAGLTMVLARSEIWSTLASEFLWDRDPYVFDLTAPLVVSDQTLTITRSQPEEAVILTGADPSQTLRFSLPRETELTNGRLMLDLSTQVPFEQTGLVHVFVGNNHRGALQLDPGATGLRAEIEVMPYELARDTLPIRVQLVLPQSSGSCIERSLFTQVVEIEPTSHILAQGGPLTPFDQHQAWGERVLVAWPDGLPERERRARLSAAAQLAADGFDVRFVEAPEAFGSMELQDLLSSGLLPLSSLWRDAAVWPESIATGSNAGLRRFHESTTWRHWYRVSLADHISPPQGLDLDLELGPLPPGANWIVTASHNGRTLEILELSGSAQRVQHRVSLVGQEVGASNVIEVTAHSTLQTTGLCNEGPLLMAELRPESQVTGGGAALDRTLFDLIGRLEDRQSLTLALPADLSAAEASAVMTLVSPLIAPGTEVVLTDTDADLTLLPRSKFARIDLDHAPFAEVLWFGPGGELSHTSVAGLGAEPGLAPQGAMAVVVDLNQGRGPSEK